MISYLGSLVQFSPGAGRAWRCRQLSLCVGSTGCVLPGQPEVLAASPRVRRAFSLRGERPGQPGVCARSPLGAMCLFPLWRAARAARGLAPSPGARRAFSLHGPSACRWSGLRKSLDWNRGLFAGWEGMVSLGLSLPLAPPPSSYLQRGWGGSSLEFLSPFVLRTARGVFRPVNFSLALPQFKKISLRLLSGPSGRSLP